MEKPDHRDFYTHEAAGYEVKRYGSRYGQIFRALQRDAVARALGTTQQRPLILDVASGTGQMLPVLAAHADMVVASDLTPAMLVVARKNCISFPAVAYCVSDATQLPYADATFHVVASSRFLHLFETKQQQVLLGEMSRVLETGGILIVDFYSSTARRIFGPAIWIYRTLLRKRPENDHRLSLRVARELIGHAGLQVVRAEGIGNFLLVPFLWLPKRWLLRVAQWLGRNCIGLSEQFIVVARKS